VKKWQEKDPIMQFTKVLKDQHLITDEEIARIEKDVKVEVETAVAFAESGHLESITELERFVYSE
jgi:TPP-dependent pyruvate/acetoin dehydrogenase alpha subunit